ncbi:Uncharacterized protein dnm_082830 [Desulfonema magnum]|uniref:Uncharacterized protein n=1 Tax=Desulfonema magnum TaxID=45655 RepID=A0A975BVE1_9BACT|nr:Uncharacterized protein dnm_082830 [Desulfonema magnum]
MTCRPVFRSPWGTAYLQPGYAVNAVDLGNSERIRSAKIIFLRLRKSIFRTPEKIPKNPLTLKSTALGYAVPSGLGRGQGFFFSYTTKMLSLRDFLNTV